MYDRELSQRVDKVVPDTREVGGEVSGCDQDGGTGGIKGNV